MNETNNQKIAEIFAEGNSIDKALNNAVQKAVWQHKILGNSIAVWRDGKVVWIPPEEINLTENQLKD